jgi:hypothetical protein
MNRTPAVALVAVATVAAAVLTGCSPPGPPVALARAPGAEAANGEIVPAVDAETFRQALAPSSGDAAADSAAHAAQAGRESFYYLFDRPIAASALRVGTSVLPAGTEVRLFDMAGVEAAGLTLAAAPQAVSAERRAHTVHLRPDAAVAAVRVSAPADWEPPAGADGEPVLHLAAGRRFYGAAVSDGVLELGAGSGLTASRASAVEWEVTLPDGTGAGRLEVDYVFDADSGAEPWASLEIEGADGAVSYRMRLAAGPGTMAVPGPALAFTPRRVRVVATGGGFELRRVQWHESVARPPAAGGTAGNGGGAGNGSGAGMPAVAAPIPADLATILSGYPRSAWRREDFEVFSWAAYPRLLIFDTADYATQARLFRRLAFFVEKRGFRGRLLSNAELASRHGWNAHNYRPEGLAPFFTEAERQGFALNAEEQLLRDILLANGIIRRVDGGYAPGEGGVLSISQASYPLLRELLITHEAFHGVFYEEEAFRDGVREVWDGLSDAERSYWRGLLGYMTYDPADEYLMVNEFQAYLLQQPLDRARGYLRGVLAPRYARARPNRRAEIERFLSAYPDTFLRSARAVEQVLRRLTPLEAGDVLLLLPADGEA